MWKETCPNVGVNQNHVLYFKDVENYSSATSTPVADKQAASVNQILSVDGK